MALATVLKGITNGLIALDRRWRCTYVNEAAAKLFQTTPGEMLGKILWETFSRLRDSRFQEEFTRAVSEGVAVRVEDYYEPLGRWYECGCYPTEEGLTVLLSDTTGNKKIEEVMLESRQSLEMAIEGSNAGIWRIDLDPEKPGVIPDYAYLSPNLKALIGFENDEFPNSRSAWYDRIVPEDRHCLEEAVEAHAKGRMQMYQVDFRIRHKDGSIRWLSSRGRLFCDEFDRPIRWTGVDTDVTEQKCAEEGARRLKELADRAVEQAQWLARISEENPNPVLRISSGHVLLYSNPAAEGLRDYWSCWLGHKVPPIVQEIVSDALAAGTVRNHEILCGDRTFWLAVTPCPAEDYVNIFARDITDRKQVDESLQRANEQLQAANEELQVRQEKLLAQTEELRRRERALRTSERLARDRLAEIEAIYNSTHVGLCVFDHELRYVRINECLAEINGIPASEHIGKTVREILPDLADLAEELAERVIRTGEPVLNVEFSGTTEAQPGVRRYWIEHWLPLKDESGQVTGINVATHEITERRRAEEALQQLNRELEHRVRERTKDLSKLNEALRQAGAYNRSLIEASLDPLVTIGPDGRITDVNRATEKITGCSRTELIGADFSDYFTQPEKANAGYRQVFQEGLVQDYPLEVRHKTGRVTPVLYNATVYRDDAGQAIGVFAAARDVTELRRAQETVAVERKRLNDVLETLPAYLILLTPDYRVSLANRYFRERFGESNGKRCFEFLFNRTEPCEVCGSYKVFETHRPLEWEWTGPDERNYHIYDFPFTDADGSPLILEMGIDITDLKRAEAALKEVNEMLERRVRERTAALQEANERLQMQAEGLAAQDEELRATNEELRKQERALLRAKEHWERTFDSVPDLIAILDDQHGIIRANRALADRLGVTPEQCVGLPCHRAVHGMDAPPAFCPHAKTLADGREHLAEVNEERLGGDFLVSTTPLRDTDGQMIGSVHVARDITGRKRAEVTLQQTGKRFQLLSETAARLLAAEDPLKVVYDLCHEVMNHLDCHVFFNFVVDEKTGRLHLNACAGVPEQEARAIEWLDYGMAVCGCVARDGERIVAEDIPAHPNPRTSMVASCGIRAYACHPLLAAGKVIGTLSFGTRTRTHFCEEDLSLMKTIADQVAVAMERIRSQQAMRDSEERFRHAVEHASGAIVISGLDGRIDYANQGFLKLLGYDRQDDDGARRLRWDAITPPEYAALDARTIMELRDSGAAAPREKEYFTKDGGRVPVLASGSIMGTGPDGRPQVVTFITDLTPLKQAERALRDSEQRLRTALEGGRLGLWEWDVDHDNSYWDERVYELLDLDASVRAAGEQFFQRVDKRDIESLRANVRRSLADGSDFQAEFRVAHLSGETVWIASRGKVLRDASDKTLRMIGVMYDITPRKLMEEELRRLNDQLEEEVQAQTEELRDTIDRLQDEVVRRVLAESKLRKSSQMLEGFFQHTITPLAFMDRHFNFVRVNEAYAKADGEVPEFFKGKSYFSLYPHDENKAIFGQVVRTGQPYRAFAKPSRRPDDPLRVSYWDWQLTPLRNERGEVQYLVLNLQDVTQQQAALGELEHRAYQLQKLTLELSQAEDRERKRMAEVLHDGLQQQLAAAKFHLGLLSSRARNDAGMQEIAVQLDSMLREAIEQSRSLSHELSPAVLYQSDLGETFEWLARHVRTKHGLTVHTEVHGRVDSRSESIKAFLFRTGQEILFNAVKHARVREARLRLQRRGGRLWLTIADQGRGFDPKTLGRTTGFGLLSIRERVGLLGGRMRIRSAPGKGSTFLIAVPDIQAAEEVPPAAGPGRGTAGAPPASSLRPAASGARLRVLLVDDHKVMREGLAALITEQQDMEIVGQAGDGGEAVELARELQPDVIIMDVAMPVMPGDEATRRIKAGLPQTRIIALSMFAESGVREKMLDAGAETYLAKTGPSEEFLAAIRGRTTKD